MAIPKSFLVTLVSARLLQWLVSRRKFLKILPCQPKVVGTLEGLSGLEGRKKSQIYKSGLEKRYVQKNCQENGWFSGKIF